jgi:hypothetical protein
MTGIEGMERVGPNQVQGAGFRIRFIGAQSPRIRYREGDRVLVFTGEWNSMRFAEPMSIYDDASSSRWLPPHQDDAITPDHHTVIVQRVQEAIRLTSGGRNATWITVPFDATAPAATASETSASASPATIGRLRPFERWSAAALAVFFTVGIAYMVREHSLGYAAAMIVLVLLTAHAAITGRNLFHRGYSAAELERLEREW